VSKSDRSGDRDNDNDNEHGSLATGGNDSPAFNNDRSTAPTA
jgi:hypothetical protein